MSKFIYDNTLNKIKIGNNIQIEGRIYGKGNEIEIADAASPSSLKIIIHGSNNKIHIGRGIYKGLNIVVGSNVLAHNTELIIGNHTSCEPNCEIFLYNSNNTCHIGSSVLMSRNIIIRCGELPHLIFDKETGEWLDRSEGVFIGDRVWIGEFAYIGKRTTIPNGCVIGAMSVVTKRFIDEDIAIAGNPAKIIKRNIYWARNEKVLDKNSKYYHHLELCQSENDIPH